MLVDGLAVFDADFGCALFPDGSFVLPAAGCSEAACSEAERPDAGGSDAGWPDVFKVCPAVFTGAPQPTSESDRKKIDFAKLGRARSMRFGVLTALVKACRVHETRRSERAERWTKKAAFRLAPC